MKKISFYILTGISLFLFSSCQWFCNPIGNALGTTDLDLSNIKIEYWERDESTSTLHLSEQCSLKSNYSYNKQNNTLIVYCDKNALNGEINWKYEIRVYMSLKNTKINFNSNSYTASDHLSVNLVNNKRYIAGVYAARLNENGGALGFNHFPFMRTDDSSKELMSISLIFQLKDF